MARPPLIAGFLTETQMADFYTDGKYTKLLEACKEAFLFMTAPADSPRLTPLGRGNLTKMLEEALIAAGEEP